MDYAFSNQSPLYLQLAAILESAILSGEFEQGQKLPSVRELALASRTNPNTAARALGLLEEKGLIETRRTAGKFVKQSQRSLEAQKIESANALCESFFAQMETLGFGRAKAAAYLESRMESADRSKQNGHAKTEEKTTSPNGKDAVNI